MKRGTPILAALTTFVLAACKGDVTVQAQIEVVDPETGDTVARPIPDLVVRLLPYDRDVIFDSLARAAPTPEPAIPDLLLELQRQVSEAQEQWRQAEAEWNAVRDRMKAITDSMKGLSRAEARYVALYREFQELEGRLSSVEGTMRSAFQRFDALQKRTIAQSEQIRLMREQWEEEAFADVDAVIAARLKELGRQEYMDTTNADGIAIFRVPTGRWWVYARTDLPFNELYWNEPIEVRRGQTSLTLTRQNAELRPRL